ncbi:MAG: hypothetical protein HOC21_06110 [Phycisphaerae bacterium]|jgi:hypothetical protein|nr:hypothetical protein [Phycisphaerae bacterium]MBT6282215.1 hypothetical protein [Phycisphaerae bacterium]
MANQKPSTLFKKEKVSVEKVAQIRSSENWMGLAAALKELCVLRTSISTLAKNGKRVQIVESFENEDALYGGGRYLVRPPLVGRDAGLIHHALREKGHCALVLCREPSTSLGLCPIVALGSGVMVRIQIEEPKNPQKPTCAWFDHALEELGDHVLSKLNPESTTKRQLDYLLAHLPAVSTCTCVYSAGVELCRTLCDEDK